MTNDVFDSDVDDDASSPTQNGTPWGAPPGPAGHPSRPQSEWWERMKYRLSAMSKGRRVALVVLAVLALLLALNAWSSRQAAVESAAAPPATSIPPPTGPGSTTTTAPARMLHRLTQDRPRNDQLRGLPDLNYPVYVYAGKAPDAFSNAVVTMLGGKADPCRLFMGVDERGWKLVVDDGSTPYPNDHFPFRVFVGPPCPPMSGVAEPQQVKPA